MIGVHADPTDIHTAGEFFELFKTPWEPAIPGKKYAVALCAGRGAERIDADAYVVYGASAELFASRSNVHGREVRGPLQASWGDETFPVYGGAVLFDGGEGLLTVAGRALDRSQLHQGRRVHHIGYDLFGEVAHLLGDGQPVEQAMTATLELHIAVLRQVLLDLGVAFVEVPPRPRGHDYICCLTHDVDFFGIARHKFDRTLAGFVARASAGTLLGVVRRQRSIREAVRNWRALVETPLVFLGRRPDFWDAFHDYLPADRDRKSTFFLVPFRAKPGIAPDGGSNPRRAVAYQVSDIRDRAKAALDSGCELAVHGIDAWRDAAAGRAELEELRAVTGCDGAGVRMHWLYFASDSPERLESAGFAYDSSSGYNDGVGYRAGTAQVFRPLRVKVLLELPLSIMDSAMFFRGRMHLSQADALERCGRLVKNARRFGGTLVVNWHDRSLAPERLWDRAYYELLSTIDAGGGAWFATAREAVDWFRWRRSIRFTEERPGQFRVEVPPPRAGMPAGQLTVHRPKCRTSGCAERLPLDGNAFVSVCQ